MSTQLRRHSIAIIIAALALALPQRALAAPCPSDTDCSGAVNVIDLLAVIGAWSNTGGTADVDGSGSVDVLDLLQIIGDWGPCVFDFGPAYPNPEAHQIGLEKLGPAGPLVLPQETYDRVDRDLGLIRDAYSDLAGQTHSEEWIPNQLIVGVFNFMPHDNFNCLNTFYQATNVELLFVGDATDYYVVTYPANINVEALIPIYQKEPEVSFAEPNGLIGGQNFWRPTDIGSGKWRWDIDDGFHDCFDGCDCHTNYVILTDLPGNVTLFSCSQQGQSWCVFKTTCP